MIRNVRPDDVPAITAIYNKYIVDSTATFETEPLSEDEMRERVQAISAHFPYFVFEEDGRTVAYCYAHVWKEKAAYELTVETTVYVDAEHTGKGIGRQLMERLIGECKVRGFHALIACITAGNEASIALHRKLGFRQVSQFEQVGQKFGRWLGVVDLELTLGK